MHIWKNISKIPYWISYFACDYWIGNRLKKMNESNADLEKEESRLQKKMLRYCYKAFPSYYKEMGLTGKESLQEYPFLTKDLIREHPEWFQGKYDRYLPIQSFSTSGSTGAPLAFRITPNHDPVHQRMLWKIMGYKKGDKIVLVNGSMLPEEKIEKKIFYRFLSERQMPYGGYELSCLYLTEKTAEDYFRFLDEIRPAFIRGYSHAIFRLAQHARKLNKKFDFPVKGIQLTSEKAFDYQVEFIEEVFQTKVYMQYGHSEACVFAYTRADDRRYRCSPLYGHVEVLDDQGRPVKVGETGEVVVTSYSNYAMPFIRYRTGDLAEYGGKDGSVVLLNDVQGRKQEVIYTKSKEAMTKVGFVTKKAYSHMVKWRIVQYEYGKLIFRIVKGPDYGPEDEEEIKRVYERNGEFEVAFEYVEDIPLSKRGKTILIEQHLES